MTIAERQAREAHDKENPWRPMNTARADGTICNLLFNDMAGEYPIEEYRYFLDADGFWYRIDPAEKIEHSRLPINWRPAYVKLTPERRLVIKRRAEEGSGI